MKVPLDFERRGPAFFEERLRLVRIHEMLDGPDRGFNKAIVIFEGRASASGALDSGFDGIDARAHRFDGAARFFVDRRDQAFAVLLPGEDLKRVGILAGKGGVGIVIFIADRSDFYR